MSGTEELRETVESIRRDRFPGLRPELVSMILDVEEAHVEDRAAAPRLVENLVEEWAGGPGEDTA